MCTTPDTGQSKFLSTPSARRATGLRPLTLQSGLFLSTPSARRATASAQAVGRRDFYPRPPRGGRPFAEFEVLPDGQFLSTPSARRATFSSSPCTLGMVFLSTPSARRATWRSTARCASQDISIHALREEGDTPVLPPCGAASGHFYPRPPRGGRPGAMLARIRAALISIHALREEGDQSNKNITAKVCYFYPRPPRGGRLLMPLLVRRATYFYPRPPRGGRQRAGVFTCPFFYFYPRPPRGGRQPLPDHWHTYRTISIHALREEGDVVPGVIVAVRSQFLSTPSARRATFSCRLLNYAVLLISIHALREEGDMQDFASALQCK